MLAGRRVLAVLGAILGVVALTGVVAWAAMSYFDWQKSEPTRQLVDRYFGGYRDANLAVVQSCLGEDIAESLPGSQTVFAENVKTSTAGRIQSWTVTKIDRNDYIGQSLVEVQLTTDKGIRNLQVDIMTFSSGMKIRDVADLDAKKAGEQAPAAGTGGGHTGVGAPIGGADGAGAGM